MNALAEGNMTREKILSAPLARLHHDVCFGKSGGKIIWQPRIGCWYSDKIFAGEELPEPYRDMTIPEIYRSLGVSARNYSFNSCITRIEDPAVKISTRKLNDTDTETIIETPVGKQTIINRSSPNSPCASHVKWPVSCEEELKVQIWRTENEQWAWNQEEFDYAFAECGDLGAPTIFMPRTSIQKLYINDMGTENAIYALYDWPDTLAAYFRALDESHARYIDVVNSSPIDIINFGDNIHCGTLTPDLFREYTMPAYHKRIASLHKAGKFVHSHWDGDTRTLLPLARETGLDGIEAITPQPQGDVTLDEVKDHLGDEVYLIDGIPAIYFDKTYPVEDLVSCTHRLIELFAPKLILGISDEISSTGDIERIRIVSDIVDKYNAQFD